MGGRGLFGQITQQIAAPKRRQVLPLVTEHPRTNSAPSPVTNRIKRAEKNARRNKVLTRATQKEVMEHETSDKLVSPFVKSILYRKVAFATKVSFIGEVKSGEPEP